MDVFLPQHFVRCVLSLFVTDNDERNLMPYLLRFTHEIIHQFKMPHNVLIFALILLFRLHEKHPDLKGNRGSARRLVVMSIILAKKSCFDEPFENKFGPPFVQPTQRKK